MAHLWFQLWQQMAEMASGWPLPTWKGPLKASHHCAKYGFPWASHEWPVSCVRHLRLAMTKPRVARIRQAISLLFMACLERTLSCPFPFIRYAYLKWPCLDPICANHFNTEYMKYEPQIISVNREFLFARVSLWVHQVNALKTFKQLSTSLKTVAEYTVCRHQRLGMQLKIGWLFFPNDENGGDNGLRFN